MPLYPYRCTKCGHRFEKIQSFSALPEKECPQCGGALERQLTAPGLQFKGAGWYVNDYSRSGSSGSGESKPSEGKAASETKSVGESSAASSEKSTASPAAAPAAPAAKSESAKS